MYTNRRDHPLTGVTHVQSDQRPLYAEASTNTAKAGILTCNSFTSLPAFAVAIIGKAPLCYLQLRDSS